MSLIYAIDHVQITAPRSVGEQTLGFYRDTLGMVEIPKPDILAKNGGAWFQIGNNQLHVSLEDIPDDHNAQSRRHICYVVHDLEAARRDIEGKGVPIVEDKQPIPGWRRFYVHDPADNRIEIGERLYPLS